MGGHLQIVYQPNTFNVIHREVRGYFLRVMHACYSRLVDGDEMRVMKRNEFASNRVEATHEMLVGLEIVVQDLDSDVSVLRQVVRGPYRAHLSLSNELSQLVFPQAARRCAHASSRVSK